ncbi:MAG: sigma-70 family RNA polymerase sigma factor [Ruminococcus sp.]|nr:sigma-70 family RNA polymerase sigma factor [Ruminococcus sp.]
MKKDDNNALAENNLGLVHLCANRFRNKGIEYDDLYSAGCIGLLKASKAFDHDRGVRFSTYAVPVILGEIKRLFRDGGTIKVSRTLKELSLHISRHREQFILSEGREPTIEELCLISGQPTETVIEALNVALPPLSLTNSGEDSDNSEFDIPTESPDLSITDRLSLRQVMSDLDVKDRQLIYLRYFENKTQVETAKILDMTQVQVSRREKKLLSFMRQELHN